MADVDSLFTNFPLEETIDICFNTLLENMEKVGLSKIEFKELLSLDTKESYFQGKLYEQVDEDGVALGSHLQVRRWLPNAFLVHFENN